MFNYPYRLNFNYNFNVLGMNSYMNPLPMGQPYQSMMPNMPQVPYFSTQMPQNHLSMQCGLAPRM